ncbi:TPA: flavoprotein [Escherichia coli]
MRTRGNSMDNQSLSQLLDRVIAEVLAQSVAQKNVCVVVTGEDISSLPETLSCLEALELAGYQLWVSFSHSASQSALKFACMDALIQRGSRAGFDRSPSHYEALYLPALSVNSMSKIALGIRDNLACEIVFQALQHRKQIIATLHKQCVDSALPMPLLSRLGGYAQVLESYGIALSGKCAAHVKSVQGSQSALTVVGKKRLITQSDIRLLTTDTELRVEGGTLITPAARDEIRRRNLTVIYG